MLRPLYQAKRQLDYLVRKTAMRDEGVPRYRLTEGPLDRIDDVLVQIRGAFSELEADQPERHLMGWFILGLFVGAIIGYFTAALMFAASREDGDVGARTSRVDVAVAERDPTRHLESR